MYLDGSRIGIGLIYLGYMYMDTPIRYMDMRILGWYIWIYSG